MTSQRKAPRLQWLPVLSVAMVVVTIGAAFGVLSGRGALIGMLSAAVMTLLTGLIGGSRYGITSPTGPMTAAIAVILFMEQEWITQHYPDIDPVMLLNLIVAIAAVMLLVLGLLRVQRAIEWVPQLAVSGFVNGIAVLILVSQVKNISGTINWIVLGVTFVLSMAAARFDNQESHLVWKVMASSFGVIILMTLAVHLLQLPVEYLSISQTLSWDMVSLPSWQILNLETTGFILFVAMELALIALLDTLLTSVIMDHKTKTKTHHLRELTGQSFSLFGVSLFGGIPGAQSTVPSVMMVEEGNHHRWSKKLLALYCLLLTFVFADLIQFIPSAVFGGLIIKIAIDVADFTAFKTVLTSGHPKRFTQLLLIMAVLLSTVMISLNLAVIGCTIFFMMWNHYAPKKWQIPDLVPEKEAEGLSDEI